MTIGCLWISAISLASQGTSADYVGSETCRECHDDVWDSFSRTVHFQTEGSDQWGGVGGCESCHGPGSAHVDSGGETSMLFGASDQSTVVARSDQCLSCHVESAQGFRYRSADHIGGMVDCASCHAAHGPYEATNDVVIPGGPVTHSGQTACLSCHQEVRTQAAMHSRHRILEGMVECGDCHEQHGPSRRTRLGGFNDDRCVHCHTDKQGPFVFEHLASRVEGCTSCHMPHGSVNRHMLQFQNVAEQCYSCHVLVPGFHKGFPGTPVRFDETSVCTNCHVTIHGSNLDRAFLR